MKICSRCKQEKELSKFSNNKNNKDGKAYICKSCKKEVDKQYFINNKEKLNKINTKWSQDNREKRHILDKIWRKNNKDKIKDINKKYRLNNPHYKIRNLWHNLKRKNFNIVDKQDEYFNIIKNHIEAQFKNNMDWDNIEIDHKIPITWFKDNTSSDIINDLDNLHPLYIEDNRNKLNKYNSPITKTHYDKVILYIKDEYKERIATILQNI